jgi:hypothetical protein
MTDPRRRSGCLDPVGEAGLRGISSVTLSDLLPALITRKKVDEKQLAADFVTATVNATHEDMVRFRFQLAPYFDSKRLTVRLTVVLALAATNHQYLRRIEEFEKECRRRTSRKG